jgi:hypothetical protein
MRGEKQIAFRALPRTAGEERQIWHFDRNRQKTIILQY